jgi:NTP pyrophosphatase (non-canonical NTP hydrolase)
MNEKRYERAERNHKEGIFRLVRLEEEARIVCSRMGWDRGWEEVGAYLHLEASEYIEAMREKRGDVNEEAADVLFVLLSSLSNEGRGTVGEMLNCLEDKIESLQAKADILEGK